MNVFAICLLLFAGFLSPHDAPAGKTAPAREEELVVDSSLTLQEALSGSKAPPSVLAQQRLLTVHYRSMDGRVHQGQLVCHHSRVSDLRDLFALILESGFPVEKCIPIVRYGWDDNASMADNNTSAFNYRFIAKTTRLSRHALGVALDINPRLNPAVYPSGEVAPAGASYSPRIPGTLSASSRVTRFLRERGWTWGGTWTHTRDWQHFEKPL